MAPSRPGVRFIQLAAIPDGYGTVLRVWEMAGVSGEITTTLPAGVRFTTAMPVNLRGEKQGEPLSIIGNKFHFELGSNATASFILK